MEYFPNLWVRGQRIPAPPILSVTKPLKRISAVTMKSSLASNSANCVLLMCSSFLSVDFIAPVIPELHREPNPIAETNRIATIFHFRLASGFWGLSSESVDSVEATLLSPTSLRKVGTSFSISSISFPSWAAGRTCEAAFAMLEQLQITRNVSTIASRQGVT